MEAVLAHVEESKQTSIAAIESIATKSEENKKQAIDLIIQMTSQLQGIETERQTKFVSQMKQLHAYISGKIHAFVTCKTTRKTFRYLAPSINQINNYCL